MERDSNILIELKDVWKIYKIGKVEVEALRGLSLKVKKGEFVAIMGPSGSGKSTSMNMVGALDVPTKGTIYLKNHDISKLHESDLAQIRGRTIGFVFQKFNLISTLTAFENVALGAMLHDVDDAETEKRVKELMILVGLGDRMNHKPNELSGGQQQRVAIARALINDPEIILADEPTGNLDSVSGNNIMALFDELHDKQKKTIILVTHEQELAEHAEKIFYLKDGMVQKEYKPVHKKARSASRT